MGAWGIHTFEDDLNVGWFDDLCDEKKPLAFLEDCLDLSPIGEDEMDDESCAGVLCTAVIMDGLLNGPTPDLPDEVVSWLEDNKKLKVTKLMPDAIAGLGRFLLDGSEMNDLWNENEDDYPKWKQLAFDLKARLERTE